MKEFKEICSSDFQSIISKNWDEFPKGRGLNVSPFYFGLVMLFEFWEKNKRFPSNKDIKEMLLIKSRFGNIDDKLNEEMVEKVCNNSTAEFSTVCAIIGGFFAQEIIKVISAKEEPLLNFFIYDGLDGTGRFHHL